MTVSYLVFNSQSCALAKAFAQLNLSAIEDCSQRNNKTELGWDCSLWDKNKQKKTSEPWRIFASALNQKCLISGGVNH